LLFKDLEHLIFVVLLFNTRVDCLPLELEVGPFVFKFSSEFGEHVFGVTAIAQTFFTVFTVNELFVILLEYLRIHFLHYASQQVIW